MPQCGRRTDTIRYWFAVGLLVNLVVGTVYVTLRAQHQIDQRQEDLMSQSAQRQIERAAKREQHVDDSLISQDMRLKVLEALNIAARLAVLDDLSARARSIELLLYGEFITMVGGLALMVFTLNSQRERPKKSRLLVDE